MDWLVSNWFIVVAAIAVVVVVVVICVKFFKMPTAEQIAKVKEWLVYACIQAEKELGSETGQLKLRKVYDMFVTKFTWLAKIISFEKFSELVDEALVEMKKLLEENKAIESYVENVNTTVA